MAEWKALRPKQPKYACFKIRYASKRRAHGAVRVLKLDLTRDDNWRLGAYRCETCRGWHVGHSKFAIKES